MPSIFPSFQTSKIGLVQQVYHDHIYPLPSQKELKRKYDKTVEENVVLKKKLKLLTEKHEKLPKKCLSLTAVISELKEKEVVSDSICEILEAESLKVPSQIFQIHS